MNRIRSNSPSLGDGFILAPHFAAVAGPETPRAPVKQGASGGSIPFRRATVRRSQLTTQTTGLTVSTSQQDVQVTIEGTGFMVGIMLEVVITTAGNSANVAYQEDGPWSALASVVLSDVSGEYFNLSGYSLFLLNKYGGWYTHGTLYSASADTNIYQAVTSTGATGGSVRFFLRVPVAINNRNFLGLLGNQDRAMRYLLRDDLATSASIYSTGPTTAGTAVINRTYESVTVPSKTNAAGIPQQIFPPKFGVQHFGTQSRNGTDPVGGSTVNHYLQRIGNTIRVLILVFRSNGSRASAETYLPTRLTWLLGDQTLYTESAQYRRALMYQRYGFDADNGVLVYDFLEDFSMEVGSEFGLDYLWTAGLVNLQAQITYPSGFGSTNNSLIIITDDLIIPDNIDIYAPDGA